jgi:hypothetical protein
MATADTITKGTPNLPECWMELLSKAIFIGHLRYLR